MTAAKERTEAEKRHLDTVKGKFAVSRFGWANLRWGCNDIVSQKKEVGVDLNEPPKAVSSSSVAVCSHMYLAVQGRLVNAFRRNATKVELISKWMVANVRGSLERDSADVARDVVQCAAVLGN